MNFESIDLFAAALASQPLTFPDDSRLVRAEHLEKLVAWAKSAPEMVLDFEATGHETLDKDFDVFEVGLFSPKAGAKVLDFRALPAERVEAARRAAGDAIAGRRGLTIAHNFEFEVSAARKVFGVEIGGSLWDNMHAAFALKNTREGVGEFGPFSQKALVATELKRDTPYATAVRAKLKALFGADDSKWKFAALPGELIVPYNCEDLTDAFDLYRHFRPQVEAAGQLALVHADSENSRHLADMHETGLLLDLPRLERLVDRLVDAKAAAYKRFREAAGRDVDISSHPKLYGFIHGTLGLPMHADVEKAGKLDEDVLSWMLKRADTSERAKASLAAILEWRDVEKSLGTYAYPWLYEHRRGDRLHPNINALGARTRRYSSSKPPLQNVTQAPPWGPELRACVICEPDFINYSFDFSQIEYRKFAHYSGERALVEGYCRDPDFDTHEQVAAMLAEVLGIPFTRRTGKTMNFGTLFGMGKDKMKRSLLVEDEVAERILNAYHAKIPSLKKLKRKLEQDIRRNGYVRDDFGGRRWLPPDESYKGLNTLCQMSAANLMRFAIFYAAPIIRQAGGNSKLQIHDDLIFRLPGRDVREHLPVLREVKAAMENFPQFRVPIITDADYFDTNWSEKKEVEGL